MGLSWGGRTGVSRRTVLVLVLGGLLTAPAACAAAPRAIPVDPPTSTPPVVTPAVTPSSPAAATTARLPKPDHVVIVIFENKDVDEVLGVDQAPFLDELAQTGVNFTNAHAEAHPSQPNYLALFSGSTQGVTDNSCLPPLSAPNLATQLAVVGRTFVGYSEDLPEAGFNRLYQRPVRPEACRVGCVHQRAIGLPPAVDSLAERLRSAADGRRGGPESVQ
jgi:hypothetical protein